MFTITIWVIRREAIYRIKSILTFYIRSRVATNAGQWVHLEPQRQRTTHLVRERCVVTLVFVVVGSQHPGHGCARLGRLEHAGPVLGRGEHRLADVRHQQMERLGRVQ